MYIEKKSHYEPLSNLPFWETIDRYSYYSEFDYVFSEIENIIKALNLLLNKDYKCLNDEEYYNIVNQFYNITFFKKDILKILSTIDKINYNKYQWLKTRVIFTTLDSEGHGRNFSWWHETRQLMLELITPEGLVIDKKHDYSSEEIKEIFNNYKVYLFDYSNKELGIDPELPFDKETSIGIKVPMFKLVDYDKKDYSGFELGQIKYEDENFNEIIKQTGYKLVRRKIRLTTVFKFAKDIFESIYNNINYYENEILKCSFIKEQEKEELIQRIRILINKMGMENPQIILNQLEQSGPVLVKKKTPSKHK